MVDRTWSQPAKHATPLPFPCLCLCLKIIFISSVPRPQPIKVSGPAGIEVLVKRANLSLECSVCIELGTRSNIQYFIHGVTPGTERVNIKGSHGQHR